jgi:photosystem II stability/assembly factor-like uncharacterized protein
MTSALVVLALVAAACSSGPAKPKSATKHGGTTNTTVKLVPVRKGSKPTLPPVTAPSLTLTDAAFLSPTSGYGLFTADSGVTCSVYVGSTSNSGATFAHLAAAGSSSCLSGYGATHLTADGQGDLFAYGPNLYVSHNNGSSWTTDKQPGNVLTVSAVGKSVWMAESICSTPTAATCSLHLESSSDGGSSWQDLTLPSRLSVENIPDMPVAVLVRTGALTGYVGVADPASTTTTPLYYTSNGGSSWVNRTIGCGGQTVAMSAAPDGTLLAVCGAAPVTGNQAKSSVISTDGGENWTTQFICSGKQTPLPPCALSFFFNGYLGSIVAVSASTAFMVGVRTALEETTDGGKSWAPVTPPLVGSTDGTWRVTFCNATDGIVVGNSVTAPPAPTIWSTSNGGTTWTATVPSTAQAAG